MTETLVSQQDLAVGSFATYEEADAHLLRAMAEHQERGCDRG